MRLLRVAMVTILATLLAMPAFAYEAFNGPTGLLKYTKGKTFEGYTLYTPTKTRFSYLLDMEGNVVNKWESEYKGGMYAELLPNGNLLRGGELDERLAVYFGGSAGIIEEFDWNGKKVWEYRANSDKGIYHHGFHRMANGNTLLLVWEYKSREEALAKGRKPESMPEEGPVSPFDPEKKKVKGLWADAILEVNKAGKIVWEWHAWDHIGTGPDQLDINYTLPTSLGALYAGPDWTHCNSVQDLPKSKQVLLNSRNFGEFYIIDRKSGSITYRWGNPSSHGKGRKPGGYVDDGDQILFGPHNATMLENGNITVFDNGTMRPRGNRSRIVEMNPKTNEIVWEFSSNGAPRSGNSFYSAFQCSVQKLPNGNYFVTSTNGGHIFEVTPEKEIVWEFVNPVGSKGPVCSVVDFDSKFDVHRAYRYAATYPGLKGKDLSVKGVLAPGCPDFRKALETQPTKTK